MRSGSAVRCSLAVLFVALAAPAVPLLAHHSFAMFDTATANQITLIGVVTSLEWTNPHVYIELDVPDAPKGSRHWTIELGSPSILQRGGWKFNSVKKGDKVTAVVSPLRNGEPGSLLTRITLADGRVLGNGGPNGVGPGVTAESPATPQR
jgi:hypothetical protein